MKDSFNIPKGDMAEGRVPNISASDLETLNKFKILLEAKLKEGGNDMGTTVDPLMSKPVSLKPLAIPGTPGTPGTPKKTHSRTWSKAIPGTPGTPGTPRTPIA